jgi:hypothetical protein
LKVSPLVARLISVPDDLSLEELHDVLQLVLGWIEQAFYNFRILGQKIGRRRHLRTLFLRELQLRGFTTLVEPPVVGPARSEDASGNNVTRNLGKPIFDLVNQLE